MPCPQSMSHGVQVPLTPTDDWGKGDIGLVTDQPASGPGLVWEE